MASENKRNDEDSGFSFGVRELRQAQVAQRRQVPAPRPQTPLMEPAIDALMSGGDSRGSDPYNTSGSFDRSRNWARVGKR